MNGSNMRHVFQEKLPRQRGGVWFVATIILALVVFLGVLLFSRGDESSLLPDAGDSVSTGGSQSSLNILLQEQNDSSVSGSVVLTAVDSSSSMISITIVEDGVSGTHPAHIHSGSCEALGGVRYPLTSVESGGSETLLNVALEGLLGQLPLAINVHKSPEEAGVYVACGDISASVETEGSIPTIPLGQVPAEDTLPPEPRPPKSDAIGKFAHTGDLLAGTDAAPLLDFTQADYDAAVASGRPIVLFFHATWCPICAKEFPMMQAAFNQLTKSSVVGFRVNIYDSDTDANEEKLAKKFGIWVQHSKVVVIAGNGSTPDPTSWDEERYLQELTALN